MKTTKAFQGRVWLVQWDGHGRHAEKKDPIAAVVNGRFGADRVKEIVEQIYANEQYTYGERIDYARDKRFNPYPARFGVLEGYEYTGQIMCGDNPFLYARLVQNLRVLEDEDGRENLEWEEIPHKLPSVLKKKPI